MAEIRVLDDATIDKIAAGEVVERPASVVKELVENAMDAEARAITVEIREGGIEFIRVTDDGSGIGRSQVRNAFMRHATSKISSVADLTSLRSMGFRGEALSSIASVSKAEIVTKSRDEITGTRFCLEGGRETAFDEVGAPDGTTFIVRNLFFNTPVRRKFLKTAMTEASYITDLLEHMALSRPEISIKYVINGQTKFYTNGDGDMKAIIYRIFGRDIANEMIAFHIEDDGIELEGFLGRPVLSRANRNYENYFVNNRYVKSKVISKAIEEGYQSYMMQHRYPFCVVHIAVPADSVDVNVHPSKMEVRFSNQNGIYRLIAGNIAGFLAQQEMIPNAVFESGKKTKEKKTARIEAPEPFEKERRSEGSVPNILREESGYNRPPNDEHETVRQTSSYNCPGAPEKARKPAEPDNFFVDSRKKTVPDEPDGKQALPAAGQRQARILGAPSKENDTQNLGLIKAKDHIIVEKPEQLNFFDEKLLSREARQEYRIIGQIFETYWMIEYRDKMLVIDQHAAHEKVKYEQILKKAAEHEIYTQVVTPPAIISATPRESDIIDNYARYFEELGFEIEDFGMNAFAIRGVPLDLFGCDIRELFEEILTQLSESPVHGVPQVIREKIASMACKAAVKGNKPLTYAEADRLIEQLLDLDNPYNCPHGRPTMISMSKYEIEKKFRRII